MDMEDDMNTAEVIDSVETDIPPIHSSSSTAVLPSSPSKHKAKTLQKLKASSPVLPDQSSEESTDRAKKVTFTEELSTFIPQECLDDDMNYRASCDEDAMAEFNEIAAPYAESAISELAYEELSAFDTILRLPVSPIEAINPTPPWEVYCKDSNDPQRLGMQRKLISDTTKQIMSAEKRWSAVTKLEEELPWTPFSSHLGKIKPEGDFDDGSLARYLAEVGSDGDVDVQVLLCNMEWLYDNETAEVDELEVADDDSEYDGEDELSDCPPENVYESMSAMSLPPAQAETRPFATESLDDLLQKRKLQLDEDIMNHQTRASKRLKTDLYGAWGSEPEPSSSPSQLDPSYRTGLFNFSKLQGWTTQPKQGLPARTPAIPQTKASPTTAGAPSIPTPTFTAPTTPIQIITTPALLQNHALTRALQALLPTLTLILRPVSSLALLLPSPTTAIHPTTTQHLQQKPLPGSTQLSPLAHLSRLSETTNLTLLLTTSPDLPIPTDLPGAATMIALPFTSPNEVAAFLAAEILYHYRGSTSLREEETPQEKFLVQAGLNAFAAQAVLQNLAEEGERIGVLGAMSNAERMRRFVPVLGGGAEMIGQMNRAIEVRWLSAAAGLD